MYSQANVRVESVLRPPTRALPSVIVDTEKVMREADGPAEARGPEASNAWWVERCSPRSAPQNQTGESQEEPEEHKRNEGTAYIQARSSMARALEINGKACQAEGEAKVVRGKDSP